MSSDLAGPPFNFVLVAITAAIREDTLLPSVLNCTSNLKSPVIGPKVFSILPLTFAGVAVAREPCVVETVACQGWVLISLSFGDGSCNRGDCDHLVILKVFL